MVAPGFTPSIGFTDESGDMSFQRAVEAAGVAASSVSGNIAPSRVGRTCRSTKDGGPFRTPASMTTGETSASGVPAQPPSANARRPPSISRPPPRRLTKSASIRSCSGVNDAASTLPRMTPRYANSSSRVFGKPFAS